MLTTDFIVNGTATDLLISIAKNIKTDVENFLNKKKADGSLESFKNLTPFAQRIEFFAESTDYKTYRKVLQQWILFGQIPRLGNLEELPGWETNLDLIDSDAVARAEQVYFLRNGRTYEEKYSVKNIMGMRRLLLEQNPILSDSNINIDDRRHLMNLALRGNKSYQYYQKQFDNMIKKTISSLISSLLWGYPADKGIYKYVVEGL